MTVEKVHKKTKKRKLNYRRVMLTVTAIVLVAVLLLAFNPVSKSIGGIFNPRSVGTVRVDRYKDANANHLVYAKANGITPFKSNKAYRNGIDELVDDHKLVKVSNSKYYVVNQLGHSHPYLTPKAKKLLDEIGVRFYKKLEQKGMGRYFFRISSLLRTQESQRNLSRSNSNAAQNSAHIYGTTFDIAYKTVMKSTLFWVRRPVEDAPVIKILSETIGELKKEGRCLVITEYKEKCFHITVR
jgi:hypothetical protein